MGLFLCLGVGLYLSLRLKFPQIRLVKEMVKLLTSKEDSESGITPFQAFATTVGARVGMGNIAASLLRSFMADRDLFSGCG